jgi:hypothetical protein
MSHDDVFGPVVVAPAPVRRSVVASSYKAKYVARAREAGSSRKAQRRSTWDWLAQTLAGEVLDERDHLLVDRLLALCAANGVETSRWQNRSKGWEGRLRMTARLALQRVVAETGLLLTADGEELEAPEEWVAKYRN